MAATVSTQDHRNRRVASYAAAGALAMLGLGYASVPLYRMFCQATGWGGTTQRASEAQAEEVKPVAARISVRFDGNVDKDLPWRFTPDQITQTVQLGTRKLATFTAKNLTDKPVTGQASFNVSPDEAGKYFTKIQCFCFTEQTLQPGQEVRMPVVYYVDPSILQDDDAKAIAQITLSYSFHLAKDNAATGGAKPLDPSRPAG